MIRVQLPAPDRDRLEAEFRTTADREYRDRLQIVLVADRGRRAQEGGGDGERRQAVTPAPPRRGRVLVVEDNELNQLVARGMVERLGFTTDVAADGLQALQALEARTYDVVLMDCHMPVMDGFAATERIRATLPCLEHRRLR